MPEECHLGFWTSNGFKGNGATYYAGWVVLDDVCIVYIERIKLTQQELYTYINIQEALSPKETNKSSKNWFKLQCWSRRTTESNFWQKFKKH